MAAISMGPSYRTKSESIQCKAGENVYSIVNNMEPSKMKESCVGLPSSSWNPANTMQNFHTDGTRVGRKRGHQVIIAANPSTEDAVIATEPLMKEDLVAYLPSGCKPKESWRFNI